MGKVYDAVSKNEQESLLAFEEGRSNLPPLEPDAYFPLPPARVFEAAERRILQRGRVGSAVAETDHRQDAPFALTRPAILRAARTVTLTPERLAPHLITLQELPAPEAEQQYRRLAVSLLSAATQRPYKRLLIASAQHGEGRTSVLLNLAGALARAKMRVLVVDTDFVRPSVLRLLGVESEVGLAEVFPQQARAGEAALSIHPLGITILGTRAAVETPAEILASPEFRALLDRCDEDFDFILFDSPPLLDSADANLLMRLVDAALLVIRPDATSTTQMARAVSLLERDDICGVVLNRAPRK